MDKRSSKISKSGGLFGTLKGNRKKDRKTVYGPVDTGGGGNGDYSNPANLDDSLVIGVIECSLFLLLSVVLLFTVEDGGK